MPALILLAIGVIFMAGIISLLEAALFSYSLTKARMYAVKGGWLARKALEIRERPFKAIATLVVLSTGIAMGGSFLVGSMASKQFSSGEIGLFTGILTFLGVVISEVIPKNIGERWNHIIFPLAAIPLNALSAVLHPVIWVLAFITKPFTSGASPFTTSEEEIALLTRVGAAEGTIEPGEAEMIQRVFRLNDITAGDMMTPQPFVMFIDGTKTLAETADFIRNANHTRLPVFEGDQNNIVGMVHLRDLLKALSAGELERKILDYSRDAMIVPESRLADDLLRDFQSNRQQLAVVVSEYGNVVGVVGIEDVLEELVGEIIDEKDVAPELIKRVSKDEIIAHGQTRIAVVNHFFNTEIKSKKTLNGFLLDKFGKLPREGETFELDGLIFRLEAISPNQIERVRITKK